jgi:hypothetical protein
MVVISELHACTNCAKARRKCGKQSSQCLRCQSRGLSCHYPRPKRSCFVPLADDISGASSTEMVRPSLPSPLELSFPFISNTNQVASHWFASPETWTIDSPPLELATNTARFAPSDFDHILAKVLRWLIEWVEKGSNPFIHRQLYKTCFPPAIQAAYLALSAYLHRTPLNESLVRRILTSNIEQLVKNGLISTVPISTLDTLDNLSRTQALLIYQCLSLSGCDIHLRHLAERHIPILESWVALLMHQVSHIIHCASSEPSTPPENTLWYSWILAESVRRLWLVVAGIQGLYKLFTTSEGVGGGCMGGTVFTSRRGFWEAGSARVWEKECMERYAGLVRLGETEKMFGVVPREEICEFAEVVLECTYGVGWCEERWGV